MKFVAGRKQEKPREKRTKTSFHPPRNRELATPAMGGKRLTACATEPLLRIFPKHE